MERCAVCLSALMSGEQMKGCDRSRTPWEHPCPGLTLRIHAQLTARASSDPYGRHDSVSSGARGLPRRMAPAKAPTPSLCLHPPRRGCACRVPSPEPRGANLKICSDSRQALGAQSPRWPHGLCWPQASAWRGGRSTVTPTPAPSKPSDATRSPGLEWV